MSNISPKEMEIHFGLDAIVSNAISADASIRQLLHKLDLVLSTTKTTSRTKLVK